MAYTNLLCIIRQTAHVCWIFQLICRWLKFTVVYNIQWNKIREKDPLRQDKQGF